VLNRYLKPTGLLVSILIVLSLSLSACGSQPSATPSVASPTTSSAVSVKGSDQPTAAEDQNADSGDQSSTTATPTATSGIIVADLGFRPNSDGFSFPNYGKSDAQGLTTEDLVRMFGNQVVESNVGGKVVLSPTATQFLNEVNQGMDGGHCEGFAALSLVFYDGKENPADFGASTTHDLQLDANEKLQREIAFWWSTQCVDPTRSGEIKTMTPSEIVDALIQAMQPGKGASEMYSIGIYQPGYQAGHAITPYAVEDRGNGQMAILVYDNNFPDSQREITVDRSADTWSYFASTNPDEPGAEYKGDAETKTLTITPLSARMQQQMWPYAAPQTSASFFDGWAGTAYAAEQQYNEIWMDGDADVLITDKAGRRYGFVNGKFVDEIPEMGSYSLKMADEPWKDDEEPVYLVPTGMEFTVTVDGTDLKEPSLTSVTMIGPGYTLSVDNISLDPGQKDTVVFSPDGSKVVYKPSGTEAPDISAGFESTGPDYLFYVDNLTVDQGEEFTITLDSTKGRLGITSNQKTADKYKIEMIKLDESGQETFENDDAELDPGTTEYLDYSEWNGDGSDVQIGVDQDGDGSVDSSEALIDEP
jgi:hypothetical protein